MTEQSKKKEPVIPMVKEYQKPEMLQNVVPFLNFKHL